MKSITLFLFLLLGNLLCSQTIPFEKGKIIDSIPVKNTQKETFALYLPTTFNPDVNSAIIFIFDPSGTGKNGINTFKKAAEQFDYVLVCSNNSKNGPYQMNFDITNRLFNHIFSEFNIDANRIYTAGFSGGSRLACTIAVLTGAIQGVIGCGAGFSGELDKKPTFESQFSYVGLVGDEDMNYQEMHNVKKWLEQVKVNNTLFTFKGDHRWPDELEIDRALGWLELQAYKKGIKTTDPNLIQQLYEKDYEIAKSFEDEGEIFNAVTEFDRMSEAYNSFVDCDSLKQKSSILKTSENYHREWKVAKDIEAKEYSLSENLLNRFRMESKIGKSDDNFNWWQDQFKILNNEIEQNENLELKKMYLRLKNRLFAVAYETSVIYYDTKNWKSALYCDRLLVVLDPERPYWYFRVAQSYAYNHQFNATLKNLEKAISLGFKRKDLIKTTEVFKKYHSKKKFKTFLESLE